MKLRFLLLLGAVCLLSSCAGTYYASNPASYNYKTLVKNNGSAIDYYCIWDVFGKRGYTKYASKELYKKVNMVAVKITNNSEAPITITADNLAVYSNSQQQKLLTPDEFYKIVKQKKGFYFLWLIPNIGLTTIIAFVNFFVAKSANKKLLIDIRQNQLIGQSIEPGGSTYGYIYMNKPPDRNITISLK